MKKKILFVINNLNCGGAERALISLLESIDYTKFQVDLLLFKQEGIFLCKIPLQVQLLEMPPEYKYYDMPIKNSLKKIISEKRYHIAISRLKAGIVFKTEKNRVRCEQRVWRYISDSVCNLNKEYDIAVGYLEKTPIYYCVEKVTAKVKIGFIHNDYNKLGIDPSIDYRYLSKIDHIVTVSKECESVLKNVFPEFVDRISVMHNIVSPKLINKLSLEKIDFDDNCITIVSIGRLHHQKGYDKAIKACKLLLDQGYKIKWYVIGEGEERVKLERMIKEFDLHNFFVLLGLKDNPYPYIRKAEIFVQTSEFEGKSIAIDEAKILHKPIVVTNFSTIKDQIKHKETGIIVDMNENQIAKGISELIQDESLRKKLKDNLKKEILGTNSEIEKFYELCNV